MILAVLPLLYDYLRGGALGTQHKHGTSPCIVLGEAGVGKTSAMCHVTCRAEATGTSSLTEVSFLQRAMSQLNPKMQAG
jgi:hypothetical protein